MVDAHQQTIRKSVTSLGLGKECKMVICIRMDLGMGKGKIAAQCCHGALAAYQQAQSKSPEYLQAWESMGQAKITLKVPGEKELLELQHKARKVGLVAVSIRDAGRTQIAAGSRTVLSIGPGPVDLIDSVTGHLIEIEEMLQKVVVSPEMSNYDHYTARLHDTENEIQKLKKSERFKASS